MGDVVNLNKYRKERAKASRRRRAAQNVIRHGSGPLTRGKARQGEERRERDLDGKRLGTAPSTDDPSDAG